MPLKSGIETILHRKFINFSFKAQNSQEVNAKNHVMIFNSKTDDGYWLHISADKSFVIHPEFVDDFENEDYNNAFYNVMVIEEE